VLIVPALTSLGKGRQTYGSPPMLKALWITSQGVHMRYIRLTLLFVLSISCAYTYALDLSFLGFKPQEESILEAIKKDEYLRPHFTYESSIAKLAQERQCLRISHSLHKGKPAKSKNSFKWVIDIPVEDKVPNRLISKVKELDALVSAGLLSKKTVELEGGAGSKNHNRYRLTVKGWEAQSGRKNKACFYLGRAKHLAINKVEEIEVPIGKGEKEAVYKVTALVGFEGSSVLPEWANHPDVRESFPVIDKLVSGYERSILMENKNGIWLEYLSPSTLKRMKKSGRGRSENYFSENKAKTDRDVLLQEFTFDDHINKYWSCISLPGQSSNGIRVDKNLSSYKTRDYKVAIFDNKERSKWDNIEAETKPYLERLVNSGLLTSYPADEIEGDKKDRGNFFSGKIYQLSQDYQHIIDKERGCIFMGKGEVNVVQLDILASNTWDVPHGRESVRYKYIMKFPNPPEWAKDKVLQAWWSDLKGALQYGLACDGKFEIDLTRERKLGGGSGSCWWAYNSVSEL